MKAKSKKATKQKSRSKMPKIPDYPSRRAEPKFRSHEIISSDVTMERVRREVRLFEMRNYMDGHNMRFGIDERTFYEHAAQLFVHELQAKVASKKYDVKTVKFPSGPWQWVKFNLIGSSLYGLKVARWFLEKHPVRYVEVTMEASAYHPGIAIPNHETYVDIAVSAKMDGY